MNLPVFVPTMWINLTMDNMPPFPRVNRFTGLCWYWRVDKSTNPSLYEMAVFRWDLGLSRFKPSELVFSRTSIILKEAYEMAKATEASTKAVSNPFKGFINVELSPEDKEFVSAHWSKAKFEKMLPELVDVGKVSFSFNDKNQTYNAALTFYAGELANYCVSSFAPNPLMALYLTWYKLDKYGEGFSPNQGNVNRPLFG